MVNDACRIDVDVTLSVVMGGYVNGYSIIRELHGMGVPNIWLLDSTRSLSSRSNKIAGFSLIELNPASLRNELDLLSKRFGKLVAFPTSDLHLELLDAIYDDVSGFCFMPFNRENLIRSLDKGLQYAHCERLGIPYPRMGRLVSGRGYAQLDGFKYPLLVKPSKRDDVTTSVFRNLILETKSNLDQERPRLDSYMANGVEFIISEVVPGDDTNIYAYTAYRSAQGEILNDWIGKKLTQYPNRFGVFSSASNEAPDEVRNLGRKLIEGMELQGIVEPEFKLDERDGKFKLMEVNLRSMMWHRVGALSGVNLQYSQWLDALGLPVPKQHQERVRRIHFIYMKHELVNLLSRRGYWRLFIRNVFGGDEQHFAVFEGRDIRPFLFDLMKLPRALVGAWLRRLRAH